MVKSIFYEVVDKICTLNQQCDHRKAFANLLISKKRISVKEISGDHDLQDLNTTVRPTLSLYDEKTKIQTLGTRKFFLFNPATGEEGIIQFRIVNEDLTPLIGLSDSEKLKLIELLRDNIAALDSGKPYVPSFASELHNDHKPLAAVLKRPVGENPIRLQRMLCRIMGYDLDFKYIKGKHLLIADALSRSHTTNHTRTRWGESHSASENAVPNYGI